MMEKCHITNNVNFLVDEKIVKNTYSIHVLMRGLFVVIGFVRCDGGYFLDGILFFF